MKRYYTYESLAELLDVGKKTLYNAVSLGRFPVKPKRINGVGVRFDGREIHKYLNQVFSADN
jgi:excisionase family DNA binding protein